MTFIYYIYLKVVTDLEHTHSFITN